MGFYGNLANVARTTFSFDKTYSTHFEMVLKEASDQVFVGRYALLDYDYKDEKDDSIYKLVQIVEWLRTNHLGADWEIVKKSGDVWEEIAFNPDTSATQNKSIDHLIDGNYYIVVDGDGSFESPLLYRCDGETKTQIKFGDGDNEAPLPKSISNWYKSHYQIDEKIFDSVGRGWDSTVWQKTYKGNNLAYVMIAELNGVVPTIDILNDPPIWLNEIGSNNKDLINGEYAYRTTEKYMAPYFDEEDKTNLYYRLHVQSPWKFGIGEITGLPENNGDAISLRYTKSEKDNYSYGVGKTGTAVDTIKFDFALPSIGNALSNIKDLLYGKDYYKKEGQQLYPYWEENINPINQGKTIKVDENTEIFYNGITYYPNLNPGAFTSVAGALNTLYTALGSNITDSYIVKDGENCFPEGYIYYASYNQLIGLSDVDSNYVSTEGIDIDSEDWKNNKYYWYQYNDIDNYDPKKKYRILEGYPSYNKVLLALGQQTADALDLVSDLQNLANEKVGLPGSLMFTDSDYRTGGATLVGDGVIIVNEPAYLEQRNYLPYPNWSMTSSNGGKIYGQTKENGLTFTVTDKKTFTIQGATTINTEEIIATNVYLPRGDYLFTGIPTEAGNWCSLKAIRGTDGENSDDYTLVTGEMPISVRSDDFYFDVVKICVKKDASFDEAVEFTPMIKLDTGDTSTEYVPFQNEYEINIEHKKNFTTENNNNINKNNSPLQITEIDTSGHIVKIEQEPLPNYFSKINFYNNISGSSENLIPNSTGTDLNLYSEEISVIGEKTLTLPGPIDVETREISLHPNISIIGTERNTENSAKWSNSYNWPEESARNDDLANVSIPIPYNFSYDKEQKQLNYNYASSNLSFIDLLEVGPIPQDFSWKGSNISGKDNTIQFFPHLIGKNQNDANLPPVKINKRTLGFRPGNRWIQNGLFGDSTLITRHWVQDKIINKIGSNSYKDYWQPSEENPYPVLAKGEMTDIGDQASWSGTVEEKKYVHTDESSGERYIGFKTLSAKVDQAGHIEDLQEVKIKLMIEDSMNQWWYNAFSMYKPISPYVSKDNATLRATTGSDDFGYRNRYGMFGIGEFLPLVNGESIDNYSMICFRVGTDTAQSPNGGFHNFVSYIPTKYILGNIKDYRKYNYSHPDGTDFIFSWAAINISYSCNNFWHNVTLRWEKKHPDSDNPIEGFRVIGNKGFRLFQDGENSSTVFFGGVRVRSAGATDASVALGTVLDENMNTWKQTGTDGVERFINPYLPYYDEENDRLYYGTSNLANAKKTAYLPSSLQHASFSGVRQIIGIGPKITKAERDKWGDIDNIINIDDDSPEEESITNSSSSNESTYNNGGE